MVVFLALEPVLVLLTIKYSFQSFKQSWIN